MRRSDFPADFVWGTATASYQIEGAAFEDGRGVSIWDVFSRRPGAIADSSTGDVADDHYHRFREDIALMADLGVDSYRFSIAWPRIQPDGRGALNAPGVDFYRRLVAELRDAGVTPWATLYHWDLPQALEDRGGWLARDTAARFADYAAGIATALGDGVGHWITLNEPWCSAFLGYASGDHAPGRILGSKATHAAHHLLLGHGLATAALREVAPASKVGITLNLYSVKAATSSAADADACRRIDGLGNRFFLDPVLRGSYPGDVIEDIAETEWFGRDVVAEDLKVISAPIDFLGINYYSSHTVAVGSAGVSDPSQASANPGSEAVEFVDTGAPRTQMGWEIHPDGLVSVLEQAHALAPDLPLYVTENGSAYEDTVSADGEVADPERLDYLVGHLDACRTAIDKGIPLAGYFAWSLLDNFEWAWGYSRRFGIVHVDYDTQVRTVKQSGRWFADFLRS